MAGAAAAGPPPVFPGSDIPLRDGDLLLHYSPRPLNSFNRIFALPRGAYSHASLYVALPGGDGKVVDFTSSGIHEYPAEVVLEHSYRMALVRPRQTPDKGKLAEALADMRSRFAAGSIKFDYTMRWTAEDDGRYYCTEFVSRLYRRTGLPDPFPLLPRSHQDAKLNFWIAWVAGNMNMDFSLIVSPNTPLSLPDFRLMAEYRWDQPDAARRELILDTLFERIESYVRVEGLEPGTPPPGSRLLLGLADMGVISDGLLGNLAPRSRAIMLVVHEFIVRIQERVERAVWLNEGEDWPPETIAELTRNTADALKGGYFVPGRATP